MKDVWWVDETTVLTISTHLLVLTHSPFFPPSATLCLGVSGGPFVPCAGTMQSVGSGTMLCSASREETARSELHIILCKGTLRYHVFWL